MSDFEPPPMDYDDFLRSDPFPEDLFAGMTGDDAYQPALDPWLPDDDRFVPPDTQSIPDLPPISQDGLQSLAQAEPADEAWAWQDARLMGVELESVAGTRYEIGVMEVYANVNTGDLGGRY